MRRDVEPADPLRIVAVAPARKARGGLRGTLRAVRELVAALRLSSKLGTERVERNGERVERGDEVRTAQRLGARLLSERLPCREPHPTQRLRHALRGVR